MRCLFLAEDICGDLGKNNRLHMMDEQSWLTATLSAASKKSNK